MKRYAFGLFLLCTILFACAVPAQALTFEEGTIKSAVLIEVETGQVLFQHNAHEALAPASTTKILTALLTLENVEDLSATVTLPDDFANVGESGIMLEPGETLTYEDLLYALMLSSANDAAQALAIGVAGSEEAFAEMMNARTAELGLSDSSWENPHGLDGPTHLASAYDLAMITREAMKYDMFNTLCSTVSYTIERTKDGVTTERVLYNHNQFLDRYDGADGVKTGYTSQSGSCLVGSATVNGLRLIGVVLNADDHYEKMAQLMDYGFGRYQALELGKQGDIVGQVRVISGDIDLVDVVLGDDISIPIELGSDYVPEAVYDYPLALDAPFDVSEPVGTVSYADRLGNVVKTDLYLARGAERYTFGTVLQEVWQRFLVVFL